MDQHRVPTGASAGRPPRILLVGFPNSIHMVRWTQRVADLGWELHLFPSFANDAVPPTISGYRNITVYGSPPAAGVVQDASVQVVRPGHGTRTLAPEWLAEVIADVRPDLVHSHEIQHGATLTLEARRLSDGRFPPWIVSCWGSDLYLFGRLERYRSAIADVLEACDFFHAECERDRALARSLGFTGVDLPIVPVGGGLSDEDVARYRAPGPPSSRRLIVLKGYQHFAGRSLVGLRALVLARQWLRGYRVIVPLIQSGDVRIAAELAAQDAGIPFELHATAPHAQALRWYGAARIAIGLSISDGVPASLLESMTLGAFPIQSDTACVDAWLTHGESGLLVPPEDPTAVAEAIRLAIQDDALVDRAAELNRRTIAHGLDARLLRSATIDLYRRAMGGRERGRSAELRRLARSGVLRQELVDRLRP